MRYDYSSEKLKMLAPQSDAYDTTNLFGAAEASSVIRVYIIMTIGTRAVSLRCIKLLLKTEENYIN
jgi:hypothetical protein